MEALSKCSLALGENQVDEEEETMKICEGFETYSMTCRVENNQQGRMRRECLGGTEKGKGFFCKHEGAAKECPAK